ncbi:HNH endonuclease [Candidatus Saccharibacteria bacterium]|nr:HNH endonuclease [Candidatus Saccharibacteria bacterium]
MIRKTHQQGRAILQPCKFFKVFDYLINTFTDRYGREFQSGEAAHIDHIIPLATATTENEVLKLCHYKNLQLLTAEDNLAKGSLEDSTISQKQK